MLFRSYEVTNDAFVDQYVAPLNVRASGYIKEVRFKEHQYVRQGDTLLVLDNREYQIKVKEAEAALLDAHGSQDVLHSGIETSHTNIAVQDANIELRLVEIRVTTTTGEGKIHVTLHARCESDITHRHGIARSRNIDSSIGER